VSPEPTYRAGQLRSALQLFVQAVERELHDRLFLSFKQHVAADQKLRALAQEASSRDRRARPFCDFLLKKGDEFTLGQMIYALDPQRGKDTVFATFRQWVQETFPKLKLQLLPKNLAK
jgi:hypothetical protein